MKTCDTCKKEKPLELFPTDRFTRDGHKHKCKECTAIKKRQYHLMNKKQKSDNDCSNAGFGTGDDWIFC